MNVRTKEQTAGKTLSLNVCGYSANNLLYPEDPNVMVITTLAFGEHAGEE
jgi:hypothetical protein